MEMKELSAREVRSDGAALAAAARSDPSAAVPSCPGWTQHDLVGHLGRLHRWIGGIVRDRAQQPVSPRDIANGPSDPEQRVAWFEEGVAALAGALDGIGEGGPVWNWHDGVAAPVRFWMRRVSLEAALHRWDAQAAAGTAAPVDTEPAVHGVDEMTEAMLPLNRDQVAQASTRAATHPPRTDAPGDGPIPF